ncbi:MAG: S8 family serine peptidase, partial [Methyloprofundus sp.]|nr:S8 family serine peptidase [Methyloprofundus sp.]
MRTTTYFPKNFLVILFFIFLTPASGAQPLNMIEGNNIDKLTPFSKVSHGKIRKGQYDLLINRTRTKQSAKVIIQLEYQSASPIDKPGISMAAAAKTQEKGIKQRLDAFALKMNLQGRKKKQFKHIPFLALEVDETLLEALMQSDEVLSISEDTLNRMSLDASIPYIDADFVWSEGLTGHNQTVAILDSGVDANHFFLSDPATGSKVISEACYSTTYSPFNAIALCSDGSTFPGSGTNCTGFIGCDHGTHVAGIAAG